MLDAFNDDFFNENEAPLNIATVSNPSEGSEDGERSCGAPGHTRKTSWEGRGGLNGFFAAAAALSAPNTTKTARKDATSIAYSRLIGTSEREWESEIYEGNRSGIKRVIMLALERWSDHLSKTVAPAKRRRTTSASKSGVSVETTYLQFVLDFSFWTINSLTPHLARALWSDEGLVNSVVSALTSTYLVDDVSEQISVELEGYADRGLDFVSELIRFWGRTKITHIRLDAGRANRFFRQIMPLSKVSTARLTAASRLLLAHKNVNVASKDVEELLIQMVSVLDIPTECHQLVFLSTIRGLLQRRDRSECIKEKFPVVRLVQYWDRCVKRGAVAGKVLCEWVALVSEYLQELSMQCGYATEGPEICVDLTTYRLTEREAGRLRIPIRDVLNRHITQMALPNSPPTGERPLLSTRKSESGTFSAGVAGMENRLLSQRNTGRRFAPFRTSPAGSAAGRVLGGSEHDDTQWDYLLCLDLLAKTYFLSPNVSFTDRSAPDIDSLIEPALTALDEAVTTLINGTVVESVLASIDIMLAIRRLEHLEFGQPPLILKSLSDRCAAFLLSFSMALQGPTIFQAQTAFLVWSLAHRLWCKVTNPEISMIVEPLLLFADVEAAKELCRKNPNLRGSYLIRTACALPGEIKLRPEVALAAVTGNVTLITVGLWTSIREERPEVCDMLQEPHTVFSPKLGPKDFEWLSRSSSRKCSNNGDAWSRRSTTGGSQSPSLPSAQKRWWRQTSSSSGEIYNEGPDEALLACVRGLRLRQYVVDPMSSDCTELVASSLTLLLPKGALADLVETMLLTANPPPKSREGAALLLFERLLPLYQDVTDMHMYYPLVSLMRWASEMIEKLYSFDLPEPLLPFFLELCALSESATDEVPLKGLTKTATQALTRMARKCDSKRNLKSPRRTTAPVCLKYGWSRRRFEELVTRGDLTCVTGKIANARGHPLQSLVPRVSDLVQFLCIADGENSSVTLSADGQFCVCAQWLKSTAVTYDTFQVVRVAHILEGLAKEVIAKPPNLLVCRRILEVFIVTWERLVVLSRTYCASRAQFWRIEWTEDGYVWLLRVSMHLKRLHFNAVEEMHNDIMDLDHLLVTLTALREVADQLREAFDGGFPLLGDPLNPRVQPTDTHLVARHRLAAAASRQQGKSTWTDLNCPLFLLLDVCKPAERLDASTMKTWLLCPVDGQHRWPSCFLPNSRKLKWALALALDRVLHALVYDVTTAASITPSDAHTSLSKWLAAVPIKDEDKISLLNAGRRHLPALAQALVTAQNSTLQFQSVTELVESLFAETLDKVSEADVPARIDEILHGELFSLLQELHSIVWESDFFVSAPADEPLLSNFPSFNLLKAEAAASTTADAIKLVRQCIKVLEGLDPGNSAVETHAVELAIGSASLSRGIWLGSPYALQPDWLKAAEEYLTTDQQAKVIKDSEKITSMSWQEGIALLKAQLEPSCLALAMHSCRSSQANKALSESVELTNTLLTSGVRQVETQPNGRILSDLESLIDALSRRLLQRPGMEIDTAKTLIDVFAAQKKVEQCHCNPILSPPLLGHALFSLYEDCREGLRTNDEISSVVKHLISVAKIGSLPPVAPVVNGAAESRKSLSRPALIWTQLLVQAVSDLATIPVTSLFGDPTTKAVTPAGLEFHNQKLEGLSLMSRIVTSVQTTCDAATAVYSSNDLRMCTQHIEELKAERLRLKVTSQQKAKFSDSEKKKINASVNRLEEETSQLELLLGQHEEDVFESVALSEEMTLKWLLHVMRFDDNFLTPELRLNVTLHTSRLASDFLHYGAQRARAALPLGISWRSTEMGDERLRQRLAGALLPWAYKLASSLGSEGTNGEFQTALNQTLYWMTTYYPFWMALELLPAVGEGESTRAVNSIDLLRRVSSVSTSHKVVLEGIRTVWRLYSGLTNIPCSSSALKPLRMSRLREARVTIGNLPAPKQQEVDELNRLETQKAYKECCKLHGVVPLFSAQESWTQTPAPFEGIPEDSATSLAQLLYYLREWLSSPASGIWALCDIEDEVKLADAGKSCPKIVTVHDQDGNRRKELVKSNDDVRQDRIILKAFNLVNEVFRMEMPGAHVTTYNVVPISKDSGVIEWMEGSRTIRDAILKREPRQGLDGRQMSVQEVFYPGDLAYADCHSMLVEARKQNKLDQVFIKEILPNFHPTLALYFHCRFPFQHQFRVARNNYIRTTALNSALGYVLGVGDRHLKNIMLNDHTGNVVHIDFGYMFEIGRILPIPEVVPIRLTRVITDLIYSTQSLERQFCSILDNALALLRGKDQNIVSVASIFVDEVLTFWQTNKKLGPNKPSSNYGLVADVLNDERRNLKARRAIMRVRHKLQGRDFSFMSLHYLMPSPPTQLELDSMPVLSSSESIPVESQRTIITRLSSDIRLLARMFVGWSPWL